jgi:hypothetical protein
VKTTISAETAGDAGTAQLVANAAAFALKPSQIPGGSWVSTQSRGNHRFGG